MGKAYTHSELFNDKLIGASYIVMLLNTIEKMCLTCYDNVHHVHKSTTPLSSQVRLIEAGFLWTEPHSKRIKMKLTIQKEVRKW